jgi:hypothetical protein
MKTEKEIDLSEQIKWHLANILPEQPESISYDYTIFKQTADRIIGIGAYLNRELITQLEQYFKKQSVPLLTISSQDDQFNFYQKRFNFLGSKKYFSRLLKLIAILLVISLLMTGSSLIWSQKALISSNNELQSTTKRIAALEQEIIEKRKISTLSQQNKKIKKYNQELFSGILDIFNVTPEWISFKQLHCDQDNIILSINCYQKEHYLNKYLSLLKKQKYIKDIILVRSQHLPGLIAAELKLIIRGKLS